MPSSVTTDGKRMVTNCFWLVVDADMHKQACSQTASQMVGMDNEDQHATNLVSKVTCRLVLLVCCN